VIELMGYCKFLVNLCPFFVVSSCGEDFNDGSIYINQVSCCEEHQGLIYEMVQSGDLEMGQPFCDLRVLCPVSYGLWDVQS